MVGNKWNQLSKELGVSILKNALCRICNRQGLSIISTLGIYESSSY